MSVNIHIYTPLRQNPRMRFCRMRQPVLQHRCCGLKVLHQQDFQTYYPPITRSIILSGLWHPVKIASPGSTEKSILPGLFFWFCRLHNTSTWGDEERARWQVFFGQSESGWAFEKNTHFSFETAQCTEVIKISKKFQRRTKSFYYIFKSVKLSVLRAFF